MENNKFNKFNLQLFADDGQGAKTPNDNGTTPPSIDYEKEYNKLLAERDSIKADVDKYKKLKDQYASENAEYKKKEIEKMSDEEKRQKEYQDLVESANKMKAELETMKLEKEFMAEGFTSEETSKLIKSNFNAKTLAEIVKSKVEEAVKSAQAEWVKDTTPPPNLDNGKGGDSQKTEFQKRQEERFGNKPNKIVEI